METKICKHCHRELPIDKFPANLRSKDGRSHICSECLAEIKSHSRKRKMSEDKIAAFFSKIPTERIVEELRGRGCLPMDKFTGRDLIAELHNRGYRGTLTFTETHTIDIAKMGE